MGISKALTATALIEDLARLVEQHGTRHSPRLTSAAMRGMLESRVISQPKGTLVEVTYQKTMNVQPPTRAHAADAGLDLYVPEGQSCLVRAGAVYTIDLGIRVAIPDGHYGQLTLRSSAGKKGLSIPNGVGVIDSGYRGNIRLVVTALADPVLVAAGERVCQLIVLPLPSVQWKSGVVGADTARGTGAFGSTGKGTTVRDYGAQATGPLTIGRLMGQLRDAASRCGNDTPVAILAGGADYEQAATLSVVGVTKTGRVGGWDQYQADPAGTPAAVIS